GGRPRGRREYRGRTSLRVLGRARLENRDGGRHLPAQPHPGERPGVARGSPCGPYEHVRHLRRPRRRLHVHVLRERAHRVPAGDIRMEVW
ncbi:unnamed protein product, partial [Ectocarpus sp. 12 AP-2014]